MPPPAAVDPAAYRYRPSLVVGALLIVGSEFLFASMGAAVKAASAELPTAMIVFFRSLVGLLVFLPLIGRRGQDGMWPHRSMWPLYGLRAGIGLLAMFCFFHALGELPLADGMLLVMTAPVFLPLIAMLWLGERASGTAIIAVLIGLVGVIFVLEPTGDFQIASLVGLAGGVLAAGAKVCVRRLTRSEPATRVVFWFAVLATAGSAPFAIAVWQMPAPILWVLLLAIGLLATGGQWLLARGYGAASPGQIAPFSYSSVVFAGFYGAVFWGDIPDWAFAIGAVLIVIAGLLALRRDAVRPSTAGTRYG